VDRTAIAMVIDPLRKELGVTDVQISLILGLAFSGAYSLCALVMGWAVDRAPRRWVMFGAMALWGLAEAACGMATGFGALFAARAMVGAGESGMAPSAHSMISDAFPRKTLVKALSIYSMGLELGIGFSLIIGGAAVTFLTERGGLVLPILGLTAPWRLLFIFTGLPTIVLALAIFLFPEPARGPRRAAGATGQPAMTAVTFLRRNWQLWLTFFGAFGVMNIFNGAMLFWQPVYIARNFHWRAADYGLALGLTSVVAGAAGMLFAGWAVQTMLARGCRDAPLRYYFFALLISTPMIIGAFLSDNIWVYLTLISLAKFASFVGFAVAAVQLTTPNEIRGRMSALFTNVLLSLVGTVVGPVVPAAITQYWLHDDAKIGLGLAATLGICAPIAMGMCLWGSKHFRRAIDDAESQEAQPAASAETAAGLRPAPQAT
ncbi:MAG: hypothetical protein JWO33_1538, partial [Caulobacteraceae bacterium]|nr:hypothetical protein [Caulobacteraceae bacterium]